MNVWVMCTRLSALHGNIRACQVRVRNAKSYIASDGDNLWLGWKRWALDWPEGGSRQSDFTYTALRHDSCIRQRVSNERTSVVDAFTAISQGIVKAI